jgi:hypothetical protein
MHDITIRIVSNVHMHNKYQNIDLKQVRLRARLVNLKRAVGGDVVGTTGATGHPKIVGLMGVGEMTEFDPYDTSKFPTVAGIYVLYDICKRPLYVGQGRSIDRRLRVHHDKFWFKSPIVESAAYVRIDNRVLRESVETLLIKFLKSNAVINKRFVER